MTRTTIVPLLATLLVAASASADTYTPAQRPRVTPVVEVVRQNRDAVVNIATTQIVEMRDSFFDLFDGVRRRHMKSNSVGSGAVIHPSGYVLTNAHVVAQASELKVIFADGTELPGEVVASLAETDLAMVRVRPKAPLKALKLGRSSDLLVGESVVAIGNPVGLGHTVTTGIISAVNRDLDGDNGPRLHDIIQTDAAINPGNSGGPLLNILGEQIGVNTAIRADAQNVGFAIPVDRVRSLLHELLGVETRGRVKLGIIWGGETELPAKGVVIAGVEPGSPAQKARLSSGDVVTGIAGLPATSLIDTLIATLEQPVGKPFAVTVQDGLRTKDVRLSIEEIPKPNGGALVFARLGVRLEEVTTSRGKGLTVTEVAKGSPAAKAGIRSGDFIVQMGRYGLRDLDTVGLLLERAEPGDEIALVVVRMQGPVVTRSQVLLRAR